MKIQKLHENWTLQIEDDQSIINATVPGSVYSDLINNNKLDNPYLDIY